MTVIKFLSIGLVRSGKSGKHMGRWVETGACFGSSSIRKSLSTWLLLKLIKYTSSLMLTPPKVPFLF